MEPIGHRAKAIYPHPIAKWRWLQVKRGDTIRTYKHVTRASWKRFVYLSLQAGCVRDPGTYDVKMGSAWRDE